MEGGWASGHLSLGVSGFLLWGGQVKHGFLSIGGHQKSRDGDSAVGLDQKAHQLSGDCSPDPFWKMAPCLLTLRGSFRSKDQWGLGI